MMQSKHQPALFLLVAIVVLATLVACGTAQAQTLATLSLNPSQVVGGSDAGGTVTLTAPAPTGDAVIFMTTSNPIAAAVPNTVRILAGRSAQSFAIVTRAVSTTTTVTITANLLGFTRAATLTILPAGPSPALISLTVAPASI